jgi:hypothetical protein
MAGLLEVPFELVDLGGDGAHLVAVGVDASGQPAVVEFCQSGVDLIR